MEGGDFNSFVVLGPQSYLSFQVCFIFSLFLFSLLLKHNHTPLSSMPKLQVLNFIKCPDNIQVANGLIDVLFLSLFYRFFDSGFR